MSTLRTAIRNRKGNTSTDGAAGVVTLLARQMIDAFLEDEKANFDERVAALRAELEQTLTDLLNDATSLRGVVDQKLAAHIATRKVEIKGDKGEKGEQGETIVGPRGPQGEKGDSIVGPPGPKGNDGSPDTPDQVVEKVNRSKRKIAASQVEGLPSALGDMRNTIRAAKDSIREMSKGKNKGGGMGNVQHERTTVTSATTTVTTNSRVAGNGYAIWAYYNGQEIFRGTHYTMGTNQKTLTLLFTPDDALPGQNNAIDLTYIRT